MAREDLVDAKGLVYAYIATGNTIVLIRDDENCKLYKVSVHNSVFSTLLENLHGNLPVTVPAPWVNIRSRDSVIITQTGMY